MTFSFVTAAAKHLSAVEIDSWSSNQHEFNGVASLRQMFGYDRQNMKANFIYYDAHAVVVDEKVDLTWYDAREMNPKRTEYRLYYTENQVVRRAQVNDLLAVGKRDDNTIVVLIIKNGSSYYDVFMDLFGMDSITNTYVICNNIGA